MSSIGGKALSSSLQGKGEHSIHFLACWTVRDRCLTLSQADDTSWAAHTQTLLYQCRPGIWRHKGKNETSIDKVERVIRKVKRFQCIHYKKFDIFEFLCSRQGASILDHALTNVYSDYLHMPVCICYLKCPASGATSDIQDIMDDGEVGLF